MSTVFDPAGCFCHSSQMLILNSGMGKTGNKGWCMGIPIYGLWQHEYSKGTSRTPYSQSSTNTKMIEIAMKSALFWGLKKHANHFVSV
jgi:hypothetical protein